MDAGGSPARRQDPQGFGTLLQRHRIAAGLSQEELAELAGMSRRGISDLERGLRRAPYLATARRLADALHLTGQQRSDLIAATRSSEIVDEPHPSPIATTIARTNLPRPLTSFVGRERDVLEIAGLVTARPLVTLSGAGGVGKTRLALRIAEVTLPSFPDGTWVVELASLSDPRLLPQALAETLAVGQQPGEELIQRVARHLGPKRALVVLDNCEHLLAACADLADRLLRQCSRLHLLATSREPLRVPGERVWRVPALALPDENDSLDRVTDSDAVRLFVERARVSAPWFELSDRNVRAVVAICRGLEGMPLSIELAAARVKLLGVDELAARIGDRLRLLVSRSRTVPIRQQTLRATLDWSYKLLSESERALFNRLSVFVGGWTLEGVESVCVGDAIDSGDVLDLLERLLDTSLVQPEPDKDGAMRYRMLETVRQYGHEQLLGEGQLEIEQVRHRHAAFYLELAEQGNAELVGPHQAAWLVCFERELDNMRAALQWVIESGDVEVGLRLGAALVRFWTIRGYFGEGSEWLNKLRLLAGAGRSMNSAALAQIINGAGNLATLRGEFGTAQLLLTESLSMRRQLGDTVGVARTLLNLGNVAVNQRDFDVAEKLFQESLALHDKLGDTRGVARTLNNLGVVARDRGDDKRMVVLAEQAIVLAQRVGDQEATALALVSLGIAAQMRGDPTQSAAVLKQSLRLFVELGHWRGIAECIELMAGVECVTGGSERAARLFGAAEALAEEVGLVPLPGDRFEYDRNVGAVREGLTVDVLAARWEEGRAMRVQSAVDYALET